MDEQQQTGVATKADHLRRKLADIKSAARGILHGVFWRTLHNLGIARSYSKFMCKHSLYKRFPEGRCMWCGIVHGVKS